MCVCVGGHFTLILSSKIHFFHRLSWVLLTALTQGSFVLSFIPALSLNRGLSKTNSWFYSYFWPHKYLIHSGVSGCLIHELH